MKETVVANISKNATRPYELTDDAKHPQPPSRTGVQKPQPRDPLAGHQPPAPAPLDLRRAPMTKNIPESGPLEGLGRGQVRPGGKKVR